MKKLLFSLLTFILILAGIQTYKVKMNNMPVPPIITNTINTINDGANVTKSFAPIEIDNNTGFTSGWTIFATDAAADSYMEFENKKFTIKHPGSNITSLSLYREGASCINGNHYQISLEAKSTISRKIQVAMHNPNDWSVIAQKEFEIGNEFTPIIFQFDVSQPTIFNGHISVNIGNDNSPNILNEHIVEIRNLRYLNISNPNDTVIRINQIGYLQNEQKRCIFPYDAGDVFDVIDEQNNVIYSGAIVDKKFNESTKETTCYGDFTNVTTPGLYYIRAQMGIRSYPFKIEQNPYIDLNTALLKMISLQRSGEALNPAWAGDLAHGECYTSDAIIYDGDLNQNTINVTGGWHDAGDYGRYVKTGTKAVNDLLFAYLSHPTLFTDTTNTAQSNNQIPDILDEARYEIEWLLKMQSPDGGIYSKVITEGIPGIIDPTEDHQKLFVLPVETASTANTAATLALASQIFKPIDQTFSNKCLESAKKAWDFLQVSPTMMDQSNPEGIVGGEYRDDSDLDERFYAAISLWVVTGDNNYIVKAEEFFSTDPKCANGTTWKDVGGFGRYLYLLNAKEKSKFYSDLANSLEEEAEQLLGNTKSDGYFVSILNYEWGSNGFISDNGLTLTMAFDVFKKQEYRQAAVEQLNYILGKNSLNFCFVSSFGKQSPQDVHSRIAKAHNTKLPGALVGGANSSREDPITQNLSQDLPAPKIYADNFDSYSTNEISIYWNSSLIHLISKLQ